MGSLLFSMIFSLSFAFLRAEDIPECESNFFFSKVTGQCTPCLKCGGNEIIREVCEGDKDTICGPFIEFNMFQQSPINNLHPSKNLSLEWDDNVNEVLQGLNTNPTNTQVGSPVEIAETKKWYVLAMALLGILSLIALFVAIYIMAVCFICKRHRQDKEIIYDPEECTPVPPSPSNRTRLVASFVPLRGGRSSNKHKTYTRGNTTEAATALRPVALEDYDADNSGQTVSSTSSHYVYFKSAEPPN